MNIKRIQVYMAMFCCVVLFCLPCRAQASPPHFEVTATADSLQTNDTVYLLINLKDNVGFGALQIRLTYDADKLYLENSFCGEMIPGGAITALQTDIPGEINFSVISLMDITGSGTLLVSMFRAKEGGTAEFDFKLLAYADSDGTSLNATSKDAEILIVSDDENVPGGVSPEKDAGNRKPQGIPGSLVDKKEEKTETVTPSEGNGQIPYMDVGTSHWAYSFIQKVSEMGLFGGTGEDLFSPDLPMTRAMFITVLHRFADSPQAEKAAFADVEDSWYTDAVSWATANGIVSGVGNNMFLPHTNITRGEIATILCRYKNGKSTDVQSVNSFHDATSIPPWGRESVAWAIEKGLIMGREGGLLAFSEHATRAETAVIFTRFLNIR